MATRPGTPLPDDVEQALARIERGDAGMIAMLSADARVDATALHACMTEKRQLLARLETAMNAALADGVSPDTARTVITHVRASHQRCRDLMRQRTDALKATMADNRTQHRCRGTYQRQQNIASTGRSPWHAHAS